MIRRLVEANYFTYCDEPNAARLNFWLLELRTPEVLVDLSRSHLKLCLRLTSRRPLLAAAVSGILPELERSLQEEENAERERDKLYWLPLKRELEELRHARLK